MTNTRMLAALLAALLSLGALTACENTWEGMGQDIEEMGDSAEEGSDSLD